MPKSSQTTQKTKIKVGMIGSGFSANFAAFGFHHCADVEIVGIASVLKDQAKELMKKYNISGEPIPDYKDLLKLDCDAVSLSLPNYLHAEVAIAALEAGKHVMVEKPLARNTNEAKDMISAAKKAGKTIFYCENNMYAPTFVKVKEVIDEGGLGKIYMARGKEQHSGPHSAWFYKMDKAGGGALVDLGIHDIACLNWFIGSPITKVFCQTTITQPDRGSFGNCEVEDNAVGILYCENGAQIVIEESWTAPGGYDMRFELYGTDGQIVSSPCRMTPLQVYSEKGYGYAVEKASTTKGWTYPVPEELWNFGYPQEFAHFIDCIRNNKKPLTDGEYGLKILNIVEIMYKSAKSGKIEMVP